MSTLRSRTLRLIRRPPAHGVRFFALPSRAAVACRADVQDAAAADASALADALGSCEAVAARLGLSVDTVRRVARGAALASAADLATLARAAAALPAGGHLARLFAGPALVPRPAVEHARHALHRALALLP